MAIYSTFFLSEPSNLIGGFIGWKPPLAEPVVRDVVNPFTQKAMTIKSNAPTWDDWDPARSPAPRIVVTGQGDYQTYLEGRIPRFVQNLPHWCAKGLTSVELNALMETIGGETTMIEPALYAHPSMCSSLDGFGPEFVNRLRGADDRKLQTIAEHWAAELSTPDYTHSLDGERLIDDWKTEDALSILKPLRTLAQQHSGAQGLYVLVEG